MVAGQITGSKSQLADDSNARRQIYRRPPVTTLQLRQQHGIDTHDVDTRQRLDCRRTVGCALVSNEGFVQMQARLLSEGKLHRQRRRHYQDNNRKLDALWDFKRT